MISVLYCVAEYCSVLQCVMQCVAAVCCGVLQQCVAGFAFSFSLKIHTHTGSGFFMQCGFFVQCALQRAL